MCEFADMSLSEVEDVEELRIDNMFGELSVLETFEHGLVDEHGFTYDMEKHDIGDQ